ncbi:ABC transporter ATP-binding protein [Phnomibacter ginsenosidimutans]|uniref:ATP-binding cassette domain-containing protein n=1 Tax=Phnomibacter ginsenosidimutans TaxID=2676868 RepID=A0A6I6G5V9_9BACT|nr:ABC transporter ATP-binding protein [Phnomibacter ginsenosidimutans]QGW27374.1 ATP-binding cassette domain-containing protein [Phnomibacter ginsenosidimutans]
MLSATGIRKQFGDLAILKGVDIAVAKGEVVSIVGASGAGKSTLLHILGTLDEPDSGSIRIKGQEVTQLKGNALANFRNEHIGFVFQFHHLLPEFTALENICIPGWIGNKSKQVVEAKALELLKILDLTDRKDHKPAQLSGGEQQRIAVARSLINEPAIVFADEPTGNLDSLHAQELHQLFFDLRQQLGQTFLIVTHNEALANLSDRKLLMKDGLMVS